MNRKVGNARLFTDDEESCDLEFELGRVSVRSLRGPGKTGPNEDAAAVIQASATSLVLAVADGVGGSPAGCEASATSVTTLQKTVAAADPEDALRGAILDAFENANESIIASRNRSATTLVVAEISGTQLRSYHVGDSEVIVTGQRGCMKQRVIPHSPTGFAVEAGLLDEAEAVQHEERHVIFNVVGAPNMRVDVSSGIDIALRDTVLLTTDGVLDNLYVEEIVEIIRVGRLDRAADQLMAATRERMNKSGGSDPSKPDDATFILYRRNASRR